jgi:hypothetical protein
MLINWWRSEPKMERAPSRREYVRVSTALKPSVVSPVVLDPIEPSRLLSKAAWRDLIANQTSYR